MEEHHDHMANCSRGWSQGLFSLFLEHDVMLIGPGSPGHYGENKAAYDNEHMKNQIKNFKEGPIPGDLVLLRKGRSVLAVGKIPTKKNECEYVWLDSFSDVLGWDLQHVRRVIWDEGAEEF
jgi:hypothetical protein